MVRVGAVRLDDGHDGVRGATKRVRSSMWPSVSSPSMPSPSQRISRTPKHVAQEPLDVGARQRRVAVRVQQALLRRQQRALAVDLDRAAFEHDAGLRVTRHAERLGHLPADLAVEVERRVLAAPGVVVEIDGEPRLLGRRARDEDRAVVAAHASFVGKRWTAAGVPAARHGASSLRTCRSCVGVQHVDVHGLALGERAHELRPSRARRRRTRLASCRGCAATRATSPRAAPIRPAWR